MSSIGDALVAKLASMETVTALVADRIYPAYIKLADKSFPAIGYKIDNTTTSPTYDGTVNQLRSCNVILTCVGSAYSDADAVKEALLDWQTGIDGSAGTWGTQEDPMVVQGCFLNDDGVSEDVMTEPETEEILYYITELSFLVWYVAA